MGQKAADCRLLPHADFKQQPATRVQALLPQCRESPVKQQSVLPPVQGGSGFKLYLFLQSGKIRLCQIGGIADDHVHSPDAFCQCRIQHVPLHDMQGRAIQRRILPQVPEGIRRLLHRCDPGMGQTVGKGNADAAAAGAKIQDFRGGYALCRPERTFHQGLRVLPGNQHAGPHPEGQPVKFPLPQQILQGLAR